MVALKHFNAALRSDKKRVARGLSPYDGWQGQVTRSTPGPGQWCVEVGLQKTMQFNIDDLGDGTAKLLAVSWCHRMQYFYDAHVAGLLGTPEMVAQCLADYEEPEDFRALRTTADGRARVDVNKVLSVVPR